MPPKILFELNREIKMPQNKVSQTKRGIKLPQKKPLKTHLWKSNATCVEAHKKNCPN